MVDESGGLLYSKAAPDTTTQMHETSTLRYMLSCDTRREVALTRYNAALHLIQRLHGAIYSPHASCRGSTEKHSARKNDARVVPHGRAMRQRHN